MKVVTRKAFSARWNSLAVVTLTTLSCALHVRATHRARLDRHAPQTTATTPSADGSRRATRASSKIARRSRSARRETRGSQRRRQRRSERARSHARLVFARRRGGIEMPNLNGVAPRESTFCDRIDGFTVGKYTPDAARRPNLFLAAARCALDYGVRVPQEACVLFDFDGDGDPEIFVDVREEEGDEGHYARMNALLTFKDGKIFSLPEGRRATTSTRSKTSTATDAPTFESLQDTRMVSSRAHQASSTTGLRRVFVAHSRSADGNVFHDRRRPQNTTCRELLRVASGDRSESSGRCDLREALRAKSSENHV